MNNNNQLDVLQGGHQQIKFVKSGKAITAGNWSIFYVQEDCVITAMTDTADVNQLPLLDIATETIKAGTVLFCWNSRGIKTLTLSSGSGFVMGVLG
jgi:hypothetical protein